MTTLALKSYQQATLDALATFARAAQRKGPALAFGELAGRAYNQDAFGAVPCVCLRIPTGGGKTLLAAHAVATLAREWQASDAPVALWPVPSDTIRGQTLKALQTAGHPYRDALEASYGADVRVCVLEDLAGIAPSDWGRRAVVVVATIQSFCIDDTDKRNVYSFAESFERHFRACEEQRLRTLHALPDAVVTADEAHNTKTDKSFIALKCLNPGAILDLTATPLATRTREAVLEAVKLDLLNSEAVRLPGFQVGEQSSTFEIYLKDAHIELRAADASQIALDYGSGTVSTDDPVRWLNQSLFQKLPGLTQSQRSAYFAAVVSHLMHEQGLLLVTLASARFRQLGMDGAWDVEPDWTRPLVFEANRYPVPVGSRYSGRYEFRKHFYPVLAGLKDDGEEFLCAQLLDHHKAVKHWARKSGGRCRFGQIVKDRSGAGMQGQFDALPV